MGIIITILIAIISLIYYINYRFSYWSRRKIPYLEPSFPLGNIPTPVFKKQSLAQQIQHIYDQLKQKKVKCGGVFMALKPVFVPIDPELIKQILVNDFNYFDGRGLYVNSRDQPVSANLATIDGKAWRVIRNKFSPAFSVGKVKSMTRGMLKCCDPMIRSIRKKISKDEPINPKDIAGRYSVDVTGACIFGIECNSFDYEGVYFKEVETIVRKSFGIRKQTFCQTFPKLAKLLGVVYFPDDSVDFFVNIMNEVVKYRRYSNEIRRDFVNILMDDEREAFRPGVSINSAEIAAQGIVFFLSGYEKTASTIAFTLYELAVNPDIQQKVREDIEMVLNKYDGEMSFDGISQMEYLDMAICETLRKYPPVVISNRRCTEEYKFPDEDITISKGTDVIIPIMAMHMDPDIYPDPEEYDPTRFTDENKAKRASGTYMPFGDGPRNCIAYRFGMLQTKIALVTLLKNFKFHISPKMKRPLRFGNTLSLSPLNDILLDVDCV